MVDQVVLPVDQIVATILDIRGKKVILDSELARLYGTSTTRLNEQVKRNQDRFPEDFMFQLDHEEFHILISQNAISRYGHGGRRKLPYVFTEHGAVMAASVLNTPKAVEVSVYVVRAFIRQRALLATHGETALKLEQLEKRLIVNFTLHEDRLDDHDNQLEQIIEMIREMQQQHTHRPIGFRVEEEAADYTVMDFSSPETILRQGFSQPVPITRLLETNCAEVIDESGIYLLLLDDTPHDFLEMSTGGHFKGKDPTVPVSLLSSAWVDGTAVLYIGQSSLSVRNRVRYLLRFGQGKPVAHWGGRYIWQLSDPEKLLICWKAIEQQPRDYEMLSLAYFKRQYGKLPFANKLG